jgi:3-phosphoglycerate kinase
MKLKRLSLNVVATKTEMTGELKMAKDLRSLETVLKIVAAAIFKSCQGRLGKTESERLGTIATLYEAYSAGLEQSVGYRKIEAKVLEMEAKYAELAKKA